MKTKRKRKIVGLGFSKLIEWVTFEQVESSIEDFFQRNFSYSLEREIFGFSCFSHDRLGFNRTRKVKKKVTNSQLNAICKLKWMDRWLNFKRVAKE